MTRTTELRAGRTPAGWKHKPAKVRQKDRDARWTKKHGRSFFGYKNHVNADAKHKLIRHYAVSDAAVHDSQELDGLLDKGNTCNDVFADSAYRSTEDRGPTQGQRLQEPDSPTRSAQSPAIFGARASEPRQEPDTRSYRACVRGAAERAGRSDRAHDWHGAGARQDRLAEPGLQHSPPGDAGTARRGMRGEVPRSFNRSSGRRWKPLNGIKLKQDPTLCPITRPNRSLFEVNVAQQCGMATKRLIKFAGPEPLDSRAVKLIKFCIAGRLRASSSDRRNRAGEGASHQEAVVRHLGGGVRLRVPEKS